MFIATVHTSHEAMAVAETADAATSLACETAMENLQGLYGDLGYDDPAKVGEYFGVDVMPFEGGTAWLMRRSTLLAS